MLRNTKVKEVWGIGKRMTVHLETMGVRTVMELARACPWKLCKKFRMLVGKTAREWAGAPCLVLDKADPPKQAGVLLMDLRQPGEFSEDLFALKESAGCARLMPVRDDIKGRWGRGRCEPPVCRLHQIGGGAK
ncbi:hypothetical protein [Pseudomonas putida]|uniref:hypothetical protein n=1 Tax=Pseudomonas putida TaxID=303 RepID=UPI000F9200D0